MQIVQQAVRSTFTGKVSRVTDRMNVHLPLKLRDSQNQGVSSELLVVEGDSAARAVCRVRDKQRQAVLPLQGKPLNAFNAKSAEVARNPELNAISSALGITVDDSIDTTALRYGRIVLLFDPDADGIHARALLILFFYRWLRPLLESEIIHISHAPQWMIQSRSLDQPVYAYTESHLAAQRRQLTEKGIADVAVKRFRGLASIDSAVLAEHCICPTTRNIEQVTIAHAESAIAVYRQFGADLAR